MTFIVAYFLHTHHFFKQRQQAKLSRGSHFIYLKGLEAFQQGPLPKKQKPTLKALALLK